MTDTIEWLRLRTEVNFLVLKVEYYVANIDGPSVYYRKKSR